MTRLALSTLLVATLATSVHAQAISARKTTPNLESSLDTPLRYRPDNRDFVIENGPEFFNRPLYGGHTAFRVDAGDKPEFSLYGLPGRGGVLRLGLRSADPASATPPKWLNNAQSITARYRPGAMIYDIRDPLLGGGEPGGGGGEGGGGGGGGTLHIEAYALALTEGLILRVEGQNIPPNLELLWAYGGANGARGARDGDIGTERVPISEYFQLSPDNCRTNVYTPEPGAFTMKFPISNNPVTLFGRVPGDAAPQIADARQWANPAALFASVNVTAPQTPVIIGHFPLAAEPRFLCLQHLGTAAVPADLQVVTGNTPDTTAPTALLAAFTAADLPRVFTATDAYFKALRDRVSIDTPDPYLNAAAGALNLAADAVWDDSEKAIQHGAVAWRQKLLGWRGPYCLDDLGWHDRADQNFATWAPKQNTRPIPAAIPPADESANLSRNEAGLHSNGDMSNSHYDMNLVHIDAAFRHILWTGDMDFAKRQWPIIQRHLAWEQRLFRRTYGPDKLPLYEAYAAIWASDDLEYNGGGTAHASAYNYFHNKMAARLAKALGDDPAPYEKEADLIAQAMRKYLWLPEKGNFAEFRDYLGEQLPHDSAALWSVYHTIDSQVPTPIEAWQMTRYLDTQMPHIPVRGPGVPADQPYALLPTSTWMPYLWSLNNVCMNENNATALAYYQAGRPTEATRLFKSGILASMFLGISPGNVGTMTYLDVYRRESQRDFGDASGTLSRTLVEGLFGIRPDALAGTLTLSPGFPETWDHASIRHPDLTYSWKRTGQSDSFTIEPHFPKLQALQLDWPAKSDAVVHVTVNGQPANWTAPDDAVAIPRIRLSAPPAAKWEVTIDWAGTPLAQTPVSLRAQGGNSVDISPAAMSDIADPQKVLVLVPGITGTQPRAPSVMVNIYAQPGTHTLFKHIKQGPFTWWSPIDIQVLAEPAAAPFDWSKPDPAAHYETLDLSKVFNDRVTQIFKNQYRSPRSPFVSLAIPKQGLGAWAGEVNQTATIDDTGLRAASTRNGGKITMPNGIPFATPSNPADNNIAFTSQFDNYPKQLTIPLTGTARHLFLLMAGSTNPMQSRFDNAEILITYVGGTTARLPLRNPDNWWPIEQDYFLDDYQFRIPGPPPGSLPPRLNLRTAEFRLLDPATAKGKGGTIAGGAATALDLPLDPAKTLQSLTLHTRANEVVVGLLSATLQR